MPVDCTLPLRTQVLNGAIMFACSQARSIDDVNVVRQALRMGADILWYERECKYSPLRSLMDVWTPDCTAWPAQLDTIDLLLAAGADINYYEPTGLPPVWYAAERGNYSLVKHLIAHGADVNARASYSMDDLILASPLHHMNLGTCDLLLASGCAVDRLFVEGGQDMSAMDVVLDHMRGDTRDDAMELLQKYHPDHDWGPSVNEFVSIWQEAFDRALRNRPNGR